MPARPYETPGSALPGSIVLHREIGTAVLGRFIVVGIRPQRAQHGSPGRDRAEDDIQVEGVESPPDQRRAENRRRDRVSKRLLEGDLDEPDRKSTRLNS